MKNILIALLFLISVKSYSASLFLTTDLLGIAFGVNTVGVGIQTENIDFSIAYSHIDTDIPERDNLEGFGSGIRFNYYFSGSSRDSYYFGYALSDVDVTIKPEDDTAYDKQYQTDVALIGRKLQFSYISLRVGVAFAKTYKPNIEIGPELGVGIHF